MRVCVCACVCMHPPSQGTQAATQFSNAMFKPGSGEASPPPLRAPRWFVLLSFPPLVAALSELSLSHVRPPPADGAVTEEKDLTVARSQQWLELKQRSLLVVRTKSFSGLCQGLDRARHPWVSLVLLRPSPVDLGKLVCALDTLME